MLRQLRSALDRAIVDPAVAVALERAGIETNEEGFDPWGFHFETAVRWLSLARQAYRYFRPVLSGIEHLPARGRVMIVGNHSGQLPFDGLVVAIACLLEAPSPRLARAMAERWFAHLPFVSEAFTRSGVVLGDPTNARSLLMGEQALLVFPEGARGSGKTWDQRYRLVPFGRGFLKLALETGTPILPVSIVGGEESIASVHNAKAVARLLHTPYWPVPALLPLLGPLAYAPLPVRFHVRFGPPLTFSGQPDDDATVDAMVRQVMGVIQAMVDCGLAERKGLFR